MGRWDKQEQQNIQQQIRELVLSVNSRGLNEKKIGIIVPLRNMIDTNRSYGNGSHRFVTGVYIDSEKSTRDRIIGNDTFLEQYTTDENTIRIANEALNQLNGMVADNSITMAKLYESPDHSTVKAFFCGTDAFYLDDVAVAFQVKDSKTPSYIHRDIAVIDYGEFNDFVVQNIVRTSRELGNRNIVLPMDDGRARILFNGSRVNLQPQDNINISNDWGIEAMRMIAQEIDFDSSITVPEDGFVIKHPVEAVFSDRYLAKEFLMDYKNRYNLASIAVIDLLDYDIRNFNYLQKHWINAYLLENGGKQPESRMMAVKNLLEHALCFASLKPIEKQNEVRQLLESLAKYDEKKLGDMIVKDLTTAKHLPELIDILDDFCVDSKVIYDSYVGFKHSDYDSVKIEGFGKNAFNQYMAIHTDFTPEPIENLEPWAVDMLVKDLSARRIASYIGHEQPYTLPESLTFEKTDGYTGRKHQIIVNEVMVDEYEHLVYRGIDDYGDYKYQEDFDPEHDIDLDVEDVIKIREIVESIIKREQSVSEGVADELPYPADDIVIIEEGPMAGEYVRIHGWTDEDPALLYSFTDASVYFNDTTTHKAENIENEDGIDAYRDREGFFMIKAEDYVRAYEQLEAHDNAVLEEIRAGHIVKLKNFLEYALPQVGHSLDFKNEDVRVKYISVSGEQSKEIKNLARVNGGFVMTGKDGYAIGIEHLTNGSAIRLLQQSREQLARDTIFARTTGPCNHFIEEELESLKHCTEDIQEPAKKQEFLMKALDGLAKQFKADRTSSEWVADVKEELQDLSKGIVRSEGLGRK